MQASRLLKATAFDVEKQNNKKTGENMFKRDSRRF
jgi:hypothetical protein